MSKNKQSSNHIPDVGKKVSSVEWLANFFENGVTSREEWLQAKDQAKAMHKEESIKYANDFARQMLQNERFVTPEIIYNETYK